MIEQLTKNIDGIDFQMVPLPALKAIKLDKRVAQLVIRALGGIDKLDMNADINFESLAQGISEGLAAFPDEDFEKFVLDMCKGITMLSPGEAPTLIDINSINTSFQGKLTTLYKLLFEIMRYNKFSPFLLLGAGKGISIINTLKGQTSKTKAPGKKSETSGNLLEI